jgi:hypothetical protein
MRKWQLGAAGFLLLAIAAFLLLCRTLDKRTVLNPPEPGTARVYFSDGRVELYPISKLDESKWIEVKAQPYNPTLSRQLTLAAARFAGLRKYPVSDPPTLVGLESHLRACSQYTTQSFFLHEHFAQHLGGLLSFYFGGPRSARTPGEWVEANLHSMRTNRIAIGPKGSRDFITCAIVVTHDSIRIIPEPLLLNHYAQSSPKK